MNNGDTMLFNFHKDVPASAISKSGETTAVDSRKGNTSNPGEIINLVFKALKEKGYEPVTQLVQYILSGDPTYITSYNNSRVMISSLERDEIVEELLKTYIIQNGLEI